MRSILKCSNNVKFILADMQNNVELNHIIEVLNNYKSDGMGESPPYTEEEKTGLKDQLKNYPKLFVFLVYVDNKVAGGAICFNTFSTFSTKDIINIHDICILKEFRGLGLGRELLNIIIKKSREIKCSKITLEVRKDNEKAQKLYQSLGFQDETPVMFFWTKYM